MLDPATGASIGEVPLAERADLDRALEAAARSFKLWRDKSAFDRSARIRKAAALLRERHEMVETAISREMGRSQRLVSRRSSPPIISTGTLRRAGAPMVGSFRAEALTSHRRC